MNILRFPIETYLRIQTARMMELSARTTTVSAWPITYDGISYVCVGSRFEDTVEILEGIYKYRNEIFPGALLEWFPEDNTITTTVSHQFWDTLREKNDRPWEEGEIEHYAHGMVKRFRIEPMEVT